MSATMKAFSSFEGRDWLNAFTSFPVSLSCRIRYGETSLGRDGREERRGRFTSTTEPFQGSNELDNGSTDLRKNTAVAVCGPLESIEEEGLADECVIEFGLEFGEEAGFVIGVVGTGATHGVGVG